ncbi:MAG: hypothetical protein OXK79_09415, partial [Chloroflexota bacterium]|nr:hypothetical protein [Chloroflexota bacterium]
VEGDSLRFEVRVGTPPDLGASERGTRAGKRSGFRCLMSGSAITFNHVRVEGQKGRIGQRLIAVVTAGDRSRIYLSPAAAQQEAVSDTPWKPDVRLEGKSRVNVSNYGFDVYGDLFTSRQLVALTKFSDLVSEAVEQAHSDAGHSHLPGDDRPLAEGGAGPRAYAEAVGVYLGLSVSRTTNTLNAHTVWSKGRGQTVNLFSRQAIPMTWDFPEASPFSRAAGDFAMTTDSVSKVLTYVSRGFGTAAQEDAQTQVSSALRIVSTDPPYYDNVAYADLSDFFYVWQRRTLRQTYPDIFATVSVPKAEELVATPYRHSSKESAETFFLRGMTRALRRLSEQPHRAFPITVYYAFKQSETRTGTRTVSTGWETFLDAVIRSGFTISGTWPMRTERPTGVKVAFNALASSIVLACRRRLPDAPSTTRRSFLAALHTELPEAITRLQAENIAPVDLAQAAIGPGMAIFTRYSRVLEADDSPMTVRMALALINAELDQILFAQDADYDPWTRFAVTWFEAKGMEPGPYGDAETLATARGVAVEGVVHAGILEATAGQTRLLRREELDPDWSPETDDRLTVWECAQHVARRHEEGGEVLAAALVARLGDRAAAAHALAYRLYGICDRKKLTEEALVWNELVQIWPRLTELAPTATDSTRRPTDIFAQR